MSEGTAQHRKRDRWGWGLHIGVAVLLLANGLALPFIVNSESTFENDTGHARADVERDYPGIVSDLDGRGTTIGVLLAAFAAMMLATAITGLRGHQVWATLWVAAGAVLAIGGYFIANGRTDIAAQYVLLGVIAVVAQLLLRGPSRALAAEPTMDRA